MIARWSIKLWIGSIADSDVMKSIHLNERSKLISGVMLTWHMFTSICRFRSWKILARGRRIRNNQRRSGCSSPGNLWQNVITTTAVWATLLTSRTQDHSHSLYSNCCVFCFSISWQAWQALCTSVRWAQPFLSICASWVFNWLQVLPLDIRGLLSSHPKRASLLEVRSSTVAERYPIYFKSILYRWDALPI